jgi:hypothetical protein
MAAIKLWAEVIVSNLDVSGSVEDPLIAWELRNLVRIFSTIFFVSVVLTVGILSRKIQIILVLTIVTTALIFFLLMITRSEYGLAV